MAIKKVLIRIVNKSEGYMSDFASGDSEADSSPVEFDIADLDAHVSGIEPSMLEVEGELEEKNGRLSLRVSTVLLDLPTLVEYSFDENNRSSLTVHRSHVMDEVFFYSTEKRRQNVIIGGKGQCLEYSVYTKRLKNHLTFENGGFIDLEYYSEVKGGLFEHCREYIFVEPGI